MSTVFAQDSDFDGQIRVYSQPPTYSKTSGRLFIVGKKGQAPGMLPGIMKIQSAEYVCSAMRPDQYPRDGKPEIAFAGRSNVGKSSLMNALLRRKNLAKTSGTPGKTQTINFFEVNRAFYFVDLPGYGYAKVPKAVKANWNAAMSAYLRGRKPLKLVVQLLDLRHDPSDKDIAMIALLAECKIPTLLVATKADKLGRGERAANLAKLRKRFDLGEDGLIIPTSAETGEGLPLVWDVIDDCLFSSPS